MPAQSVIPSRWTTSRTSTLWPIWSGFGQTCCGSWSRTPNWLGRLLWVPAPRISTAWWGRAGGTEPVRPFSPSGSGWFGPSGPEWCQIPSPGGHLTSGRRRWCQERRCSAGFSAADIISPLCHCSHLFSKMHCVHHPKTLWFCLFYCHFYQKFKCCCNFMF